MSFGILGPFPDPAFLAAMAAKMSTLGSGQVSIVAPVLESGDVQIIAGDSYHAVDGRALAWESDSWPDLDGAVVTLTAIAQTTGETGLDQVPCLVVRAAGMEGGAGRVECELTSAHTAALSPGLHRYSLNATLASGHNVTLARGDLRVEPNLEGGA